MRNPPLDTKRWDGGRCIVMMPLRRRLLGELWKKRLFSVAAHPSFLNSSHHTPVVSPFLPGRYYALVLDSRIIRLHGRRTTPERSSPEISAKRLSPAYRPTSVRFISTVVNAGRAALAIGSQLSNPTTATSLGTRTPRSRSASAAPRAN